MSRSGSKERKVAGGVLAFFLIYRKAQRYKPANTTLAQPDSRRLKDLKGSRVVKAKLKKQTEDWWTFLHSSHARFILETQFANFPNSSAHMGWDGVGG